MGTTGSVSTAACLLAVILVFKRKLHKRLVYRLAAYQVSAGLSNAVTAVFQFLTLIDANSMLCNAIGFFSIYTLWINLMFTAWMTFHLFWYAVCFKNLRRMEKFYLVTSLLLPSAIAAIPLSTGNYGTESICWITFKKWNGSIGSMCYPDELGIVEEFTLWVGPAFLLLLAVSVALVVMVTILTCRVCKNEGVMIRPQRTALIQILPLAAYPITLCILLVPIMVFRIHYAYHIHLKPSHALFTTSVLSYSSIGLVASGTLVVHMCMFAHSSNVPPLEHAVHHVLTYQAVT